MRIGLALLMALGLGLGSQAHDSLESDPLGYVVDVDALDDPEVVARGLELYGTGCVSCHGEGGTGGRIGPSLVGAGAASAHFYLTSGRMPASGAEGERKPVVYDPDEIEALVAYVASLGGGQAIPDIDPAAADLAMGGEIYRSSCASCHSATGAGGALSYGRNAPSLAAATPVQVAEAVLIGPGEMPLFGIETLTGDELDSVVAYVEYLKDPEDVGGLPLGGVGPIPEGFVAIVVGLGATLLAALWVGRRVGESSA